MNNFNTFVKTSTNTINLTVDNIEVDNQLQVTNQLDINQAGDIVTAGNITCGNILCNSINITSFSSLNLVVSGTSQLLGAITAYNTLNVSGGATFESSINNKDTLTTNNLNVTNNTNLNGPITAFNTLNVSGFAIFENVINSKNTLNTNNLNVTGGSSFNSTINVNNGNLDMNNGKILDVANYDNTGLPLNISTITDHDITLARYTGVSLILKNNYINNNGPVITSGNLTLNSALNVSGVSTLGNVTTNNQTSNSLFCGNVDASVLNLGTSASSINIGCGSALQTVNIGSSGGGTTTINIGETTSDIVNIAGTIVNVTSQNLLVTDKLISLNVGALGAGTARNSGLQIRDNNNDNQAYIQVSSVGTSYDIKAPENNFVLNTGVLTQNETVAYQSNLNNLSANSAFKSDISGLTSIYQTITNVSNLSGNSAFKSDISGLTSIYGTITSLSNLSSNSAFKSDISGLTSIYFKQSGGVITGATSINSTLNTTNDLTIGDSIGQKILNINAGASQNSLLRFNTNKGAENWSHWIQPNSDYNLIYRNNGGADFIVESTLAGGGSKIINPIITMTSSLNVSGACRMENSLNLIGSLNITTASSFPASFRKNTSSGDSVIEIGRSSLTDAGYYGVEGNTVVVGHRGVRQIMAYDITTGTTQITTGLGVGKYPTLASLDVLGSANLDGNFNYHISGVKLNRNVSFGFDGSTTPTLSRVRPSGVSAGITRNGTGYYVINISGPSNFLASSAGVPTIHINTSDHRLTASIVPAGGNSLDIYTYSNGAADNLVGATMWISYNYD